jgi:hypothetical protein
MKHFLRRNGSLGGVGVVAAAAGAFALGAISVGALAIGRLVVGRPRFGSPHDLTVLASHYRGTKG